MALSAVLVLVLAGCQSKNGPVVFQVHGQIRDYTSQLPITGANVALVGADGRALGDALTSSDGSYAIDLVVDYLDGVEVIGTITDVNHVETQFYRLVRLDDPEAAHVVVNPGRVLEEPSVNMPLVSLAPNATGTGSISGRVYDAVSPDQVDGIPGLVIRLCPGVGIDCTPGQPGVTVSGADPDPNQHSDDGAYVFDAVPAGTYTVWVDGGDTWMDASFPVVSVGGGHPSPNQNGATTTKLGPGEFRAVLTWGETPPDLDTHVTGPSGANDNNGTTEIDESRFHVYFASKTWPVGLDGSPDQSNDFLDVDDTTSFGPETFTCHHILPGRYRYSVHDYTNLSSLSSNAMSFSRAIVQLWVEDHTFESWEITPGRGGTNWTVFEVEGSTGAVYFRDDWKYTPDFGNAANF
jgi:hypothetical protein